MNVFEKSSFSVKKITLIFVIGVICLLSISLLAFRELLALKDSYTWVNHTFNVENHIRKVSGNIDEYYIQRLQSADNNSIKNINELATEQKIYIDSIRSLTSDNLYQQQNSIKLAVLTNEFYNDSNSISNSNIEILYKKTQHSIDIMLLEEQRMLLKRQKTFEEKTRASLILFLIVIIVAIGFFTYNYIRINKNRLELQHTQQFLNRIISSTDNITSYFSPIYNGDNELIDFKIVFTSEDIKEVIGKKSTKIRGKLVSEVYPILFKNGVFDILKSCVENPGELKNYVRKFNFIGEDFWFDSSALELDGGVVISSKNITKLITTEQKTKKLNKQLTKQNKALVTSNEELEAFSRIASHDLQEPLRKIQMFVDRVFESDMDNLSSSGKKYLAKSMDAADRMQNLIKYLLTYSRVNRKDAKLTTVDLNTIINSVSTEFFEALQNSNAVITTETLPVIKGVAFQLEQLFNNLISNSIKYRDTHRPLKIKISSKIVSGTLLPKTIATKPEKTYYCIEVNDNGIGFDEQNRTHIFEIFQRLHLKDEYSGYGIGLSICKKIMHSHEGYISAYGEKDKGATFQLFFPKKNL